MKKKLIIDVIIFLILLICMEYSITGNLIHEIIGLIFFLGIIVHLLKNKVWIKNSTINYKKVDNKGKKNYLLDSLLLIITILIMISGILISKDIFAFLNIEFNDLYYQIHKITSYIFMLIIFIHLIFHTSMITKFLKKSKLIVQESKFQLIFILIVFILSIISFRNLITKNKPNDDKSIDEDDKPSITDENKDLEIEDEEEKITEDDETLEEYLSSKICPGCPKGCLLSAPRCSRGNYYRQQEIQQYNDKYAYIIKQYQRLVDNEENEFIIKI